MKSYTLLKIPKDVSDIIFEEQAKIKIAKGTNQFSFESTIYNLIRRYKRLAIDCEGQSKQKAA